MEYFPWFAWIAIAGIAAFAVTPGGDPARPQEI